MNRDDARAIQRRLDAKDLLNGNDQVARLFTTLMRTLGRDLEGIVFDDKGAPHLSVRDIADITGLSPERIRGLVSEGRLQTVKPGGSEMYVGVASALLYVSDGRKSLGRPRNPRNTEE